MIKKSIENNIQKAYQCLHSLSPLSSGAPPAQVIEGAALLEDLSKALEELAAMSEEIEQQNEELQIAQQALVFERKRYQDLFEFAPDGYLVTDVLGKVLEANRAVSLLLNTPPERLRDKPLIIYIAPSDRRAFHIQLQNLIALQENIYLEVNLQPWHQPIFVAGVTIATVHDAENQVVALRWLIRNISSQKQTEALAQNQLVIEREFNQLKSQLTQIIHHEFRNPLGVISASAQLLERYNSQLSACKRQDCFQRIYSNIESLTEMLEEIFWVDRAYSGQVTCRPQPVNAELFCRALVNQYQTKVGEQYKITLTCRGDFQSVNLDLDLLKLILGHLLSNAFKYSLVGSQVWVDVTEQDTQISFSIRDQGIGIALEDQPHLFKPFYRPQNLERVQGMGLGLVIVKQAVELHRGTISVSSELGQGSTFEVKLPTQFS